MTAAAIETIPMRLDHPALTPDFWTDLRAELTKAIVRPIEVILDAEKVQVEVTLEHLDVLGDHFGVEVEHTDSWAGVRTFGMAAPVGDIDVWFFALEAPLQVVSRS